ncbi:MAG: hypothetical protein APR54_13055 [Candidatus Cloacimonas sp. SDB]|nr:MAG: hypothetical protein APR54_13055 [Candidatus Cloacimonas sp. SDB]
MNIKFEFKREKIKILVMVILLAGACFLTYYFHAVVGKGTVFTHLFYIPIILSALWWKRKGIAVAIFLVALLIFSHFLLRTDVETINDLLRAPMFILVAVVAIFLTEKIVKIKDMLCEKNEYLEKLINHANTPIIVWDKEGNIIRFNTAFEDLTKYQSIELIGKHFTTIFNGRTEEEVLRKIEQTLKGEYLKSVEITVLDKHGNELILLWNSANVYSSDGKNLIATIAQGTDITRRKRAEEALSISKAYTESIIQNFLDTLIVVDTEAKIKTINPATCDLLGYTEEELLGKPITIIFAAEEEEEEEVRRFFQFFREPEKIEDLRSQDTIRNRELTYKTKDGRLIPMLFNTSILFDDMGNVTSVVAGAKDIKDIKRAELAIKKERNFSRNIIATVPDSLIVVDKDLKIKSANRSFYESFHMEKENLIGASITEILVDKDGKLSMALLNLFGTEDMLNGFELQYQSKKNEKLILNIIARTIIFAEEEEEEEEEEELIVLQDITSRKQAEETLRRFNEELELKVKERTEELHEKIKESEKQRVANLVILNDLNKTTKDLKAEISVRKQTEKVQRILFNISNILGTTENLSELFKKIREFLGEIIDTTNFYVALHDEETDTISLAYDVDEKDSYKTFPAGKTLTKYVVQTAKPLFAQRAELDKLTQKGIIDSIGTPSELWLGVPLLVGNQVIGVIALQSYDDPELYSREDIGILTFVSEEIALAIKRTQAEEQIRKDLNEKNILLKELYHRTKNNMQVIASMLKLQARHLGNEQLYNSYQEVIIKINSMALVHQKLYEAKDLSSINLKEYISDLADNLRKSYGIKETKVELKFNLQKVFVNIDAAIPLSLVLTELISNAFKHAFPGEKNGRINLTLVKDEKEKIVLELADNGVGVPDNIDLRKTNTIGLQNVFTLVEYQLNGKIGYNNKNGLHWRISFQHDAQKVRV